MILVVGIFIFAKTFSNSKDENKESYENKLNLDETINNEKKSLNQIKNDLNNLENNPDIIFDDPNLHNIIRQTQQITDSYLNTIN